MPQRRSKGRKTKSRTGSAKTTRGASSKTKKKSTRSKATKAAPSRKTARKKSSRRGRTKTAARKKSSRRGRTKTAARKKATRASSRSGRTEVHGEGNETALRAFRRDEKRFVQRNKGRAPKPGEETAEAPDSGEGNELRQADEIAKSHYAGDEE